MLYLYIVRTSTKSSEKRSTRDVVHEEGRKRERCRMNCSRKCLLALSGLDRICVTVGKKVGIHTYSLGIIKKVLLNVI
jgi:hypothetical protein